MKLVPLNCVSCLPFLFIGFCNFLKIDFDTLRARLPKEIGDDIVRLIATSPEALEDFATIQTQQDVNNFNMKYDVELILPAEA